MLSLDDYYYFYLVVKHGGFSHASEASYITKSKLSRRILDLEARFNVSLIQRSTRHFKVTPLGQEFYAACCKIVEQAECAQNILMNRENINQGLIKISCPPMMMHYQIRPLLNQFLQDYPQVQVEIELTSRRVDVLHDDIDLAIRTNFKTNEDSQIIVRDVIKTHHCLVASPILLQGKTIENVNELVDFPSITLGTQQAFFQWNLYHEDQQQEFIVPLQPRIKSNDLAGVYYAALDGLGIADLPYLTVQDDIAHGRLIRVLPMWCSNLGTVQLVYASRKGQSVLMQNFIDYLVENLRKNKTLLNGYV